jgi:3-mercaptopyruvate sulfurtransferase SseA
VTLRDELRADERHGRVPRAPNIRWKELLGLKKAPKKQAAATADAAAGTSTDAHMVGRH